ncbi:von Willebrand factor type A [Geobacillus thermoleovorans CCB_US3_UF5]|uniref:von Willebrand factor type A n=2 Tax=Geobacillus thermoleovorans group TaxID=1505648 RepID=U2Y5Z8_GEOKU|nr:MULTISPECIES: VWA domain-containing protein [Geobacillus thermoleovorans group]AEV20265.1 von Willebrand factor type A [Geobacillus thermoleovorans CCB_US3_UF5]QDY74190.1 VWA domain-containing protein [Geobacillus thermoleovorans]GAD12063.1 von Willebrand factor type A [Geobacillus kaustophilus GBlys]
MKRWRGWLLWGMLFWLMASLWPMKAGVVYADQTEGAITFVSDEKIEGWATAPGSGNGQGNSIRYFMIRIQPKEQSGTAVSYRAEAVEAPADRNGEKKYTFSLDMRGKWPSAPGTTVTYQITVDAYRVLGNGKEDVYFSFPQTPYQYTRQTEANTAKLDFSLSFSQPEYAKPPNGDAQGRLDVTLVPQGAVSSPVRPPIDVVFVFDVSGSMTWEKLSSAKTALRSAVDYFKAHSHPNDRFALIPFSDQVKQVVPFGDQPNVAAQLEKIRTVGDSLTAGGGTNYSAALSLAQSYFNDPVRKKYVIFLTDGMPTTLNATETITYREVERILWFYYYTGEKITAPLPLTYELYTNGKAGIRFIDKRGFSRLFTSDGWDYVNGADIPLGRSDYPFSYSSIEKKIRDHAINVAKALGMNNITLYSIGFGSNDEVDMSFLQTLSATAGGEARQGTTQNLTALFQQFSQLATTPAITGTIRIPLSSFGGNVAVAENGQVWLDENKQNAYISFSIPYEVGKPAPAPITIPVSVSFKQKGTYTLTTELTYRDVYGQLQPPIAKSATISIVVKVHSLTLGDYKPTMNVDEMQTIPVTIEPSDATNPTLAWTSSDPSVASVDQNGTVTALKPGTVTITVRATDGSNASASAAIKVMNPYVALQGMEFRRPVLYMKVGERLDAAPELRFVPSNASDRTLRSVTSSDSRFVDVVQENGRWYLEAVDVGYAYVTATANARTPDGRPIQASVWVFVQPREDEGGSGSSGGRW